MLSTKPLRPLALIAILGIVAMTESAEGAETKRRRIMQNPDDPYLAFVPGQPLLFAAERGRSVLFLRYPDLEVDQKLDMPLDRKLDVIKASPDGTWIAGFFEDNRISEKGSLRVWKIATGKTSLLVDDASRGFDFLDNNRLVVWQPKSGGITQWTLGEPEARLVGTVVSGDSVHRIFMGRMYHSPDGRYLLIKGTCRGGEGESQAKTDWWDYCVYDLKDGSTVGWSEDPESMASNNPSGKFSRQFTELLIGTNIDATGGVESGCKKVGERRELCNNAAAVTLIETAAATEVASPAPPPPPPPPPKEVQYHNPGLRFGAIVQELKDRGKAAEADAEASRARRAAAVPNRRALWTIRAGDEIGRFINSCALSPDGRWVAIASMGVTVSLFDTQHLEPKKNLLNGEWQEPVMVKQFEMP